MGCGGGGGAAELLCLICLSGGGKHALHIGVNNITRQPRESKLFETISDNDDGEAGDEAADDDDAADDGDAAVEDDNDEAAAEDSDADEGKIGSPSFFRSKTNANRRSIIVICRSIIVIQLTGCQYNKILTTILRTVSR